ncbi:MAG: LytTR family DNA-binding domain-containing protein [Tannerella sp.]|jgi:two-component system LytT family response regulator|nr:LytTR family DNA-binding domain-containing protein [Tannerella sp.]
MKAVIVEDEYVAAQTLQRMLESMEEDIEILAVLQSIEDSVNWFSQNESPDLAFMDIHLADGYSFVIFEQIKIECPIVFTTAYDEYAMKAFEVNSIDYLLKPINKKDLERAIAKYKNFSSRMNNADLITQLIGTLKNTKAAYKSNFLIPHKDKLLPLSTDKIAYVCSEYKMAKIVTFNQQSYTLDTSLDELSKQLDPSMFFRANRQYLLAHRAIDDISVWFGGKLAVNLTIPTSERVTISRARVADFKDWYTQNYADV